MILCKLGLHEYRVAKFYTFLPARSTKSGKVWFMECSICQKRKVKINTKYLAPKVVSDRDSWLKSGSVV